MINYSRIVGDAPLISVCIKYHSLFVNRKIDFDKSEKDLKEITNKLTDKNIKLKEYVDKLKENYNILLECCEYAYITIVFSCMYLEAFIYDYAATSTSDTYVKKNLDKLNFISKWVIYPKIVTGKEIKKGSKSFQLLTELHDMRNDIIHLKSSDIPIGKELFNKLNKNREILFKVASNAKDTIYSILVDLKNIDPEHPKFHFDDLEKFHF